jgi:hypothetical protein
MALLTAFTADLAVKIRAVLLFVLLGCQTAAGCGS